MKMLTVDDVLWTYRLMARISDRQWRDAFRAAGYEDAEQRRYISKLKSRLEKGLRSRARSPKALSSDSAAS